MRPRSATPSSEEMQPVGASRTGAPVWPSAQLPSLCSAPSPVSRGPWQVPPLAIGPRELTAQPPVENSLAVPPKVRESSLELPGDPAVSFGGEKKWKQRLKQTLVPRCFGCTTLRSHRRAASHVAIGRAVDPGWDVYTVDHSSALKREVLTCAAAGMGFKDFGLQ